MIVRSFFFFKQKTAYEMRISDWSSDVCSSDLPWGRVEQVGSAHDIGDALRGVVDHHRQLVRPAAVGAFEYEIAHLRGDVLRLGAEDRVYEFDPATRSEERRERKECCSTCRSGWCAYH